MNIYFAPIEGVGGYLLRNAYHRYFKGVDKYFTPFISPNQNHLFTSKEFQDILPEHNQGMYVVPQILSNKAEDFLWASKELETLGYKEINLNLGCPSRTVVTKKRGSGFLAYPEDLRRFLDEVFMHLEAELSLKVRIGMHDEREFEQLLPIYNQYPLKELIIHARLQSDYYKGKPRMDVFKQAVAESKNPLCYNGDLFSLSDYETFMQDYPEIDRVMCGRGLLANPGLIFLLRNQAPLTKEQFITYHNDIYEGYHNVMSGERNVLFKMKELWSYFHCLFEESEKYVKKIRKSNHCKEYEEITSYMFSELSFLSHGGFSL